MKRRLRIVSGAAVLVVGVLASAVVSSQAPYSPPKTPWGDPDLQGIWPGTDSVSVPFTGTAVRWIGPKTNNHGNADVYLDGVK